MRAAVYHGPGDVRVEDVPEPTPGPGEVLLEVLRSGMCGTDATEWSKGPKAFPLTSPHPVTGHVGPMVLGHEFVGRVLEAAPGGRHAVGDLVASGAGVWCGRCDRCLEGRTNICRRYFTLGLSTHGAMSERVAVADRTLTAVPATLSVDHAGLAQPVAVGLHAARRAGVAPGDRVVVIGAGAIGSFVLAGLRSLGPADITVVDFAGDRLERATAAGCRPRRRGRARHGRRPGRAARGTAGRTSSSRPVAPPASWATRSACCDPAEPCSRWDCRRGLRSSTCTRS